MMDLASHIVSNKSGHFDPSHFEDRYENALVDLLKKKQAGEKITPARGAPPPRVVNLMDSLRASQHRCREEEGAGTEHTGASAC
jgi:DNA end-binding protein Ku